MSDVIINSCVGGHERDHLILSALLFIIQLYPGLYLIQINSTPSIHRLPFA